ncbi:MAG: hypothetical protein IJU58_02835 [Clostridia bacterium]|nr:hypothetical protein [Clostridia bacterium]
MDFFRFRLSREKDEYTCAVARLIHSINLEGMGHIDIDYRIERIDGVLVCTLNTSEDKVRNVLTKLPIFLSKTERKTPIKFDMMGGYKYINGNYPTAITMWLCGYIGEEHIKEKSLFHVQNVLNDHAQKYYDCLGKKLRPVFVINNDRCIINDKVYYPVMFCQEPKSYLGKILNNNNYNKDLKSTYASFYKAAYYALGKKAQGSILKADICGNKAILNNTNLGYEDLPFEENKDDLSNEASNKMLGLTRE